MKIYVTYDKTTKEGYEVMTPNGVFSLKEDSVDEIETNVLEKVPNLVTFIQECYRVLKTGSVMKVTAPYFMSSLAWASPLTVRGVSELTLNFASKEWRKQNNYSEFDIKCDFEVVGNFTVESTYMQRSDVTRGFWMKHYNNVVQAILFTLTKKAPE